MTAGEVFTPSQGQHQKSDDVQLAPATRISKTVEALSMSIAPASRHPNPR